MAISKELQALNEAYKRKDGTISDEDYSRQFRELADASAKARADALKATQVQTPVKGSDFVKMWTGEGTASVNPNYVAQKEQQGWVQGGPDQQEMAKMIEMARAGTQGTWTPGTGVGEKTTQVQPPTQMVGGGVSGGMSGTGGTTAPNYSNQISGQYNEQTKMLVNQLKQKIAEARAQQEGIISNAPRQFDPLRSQSELAKGQQLRSALERSSLLGDRGGIGRSQALQTQTAGENRLNAINLQQQGVIDAANQQIANLESQGRFEEANILSQQKLAELQSLMAEQQRQDEIARQQSQLMESRAYTEGLAGEEQAREDFGTQIMANYNDLAGFAQRLQASGAPQWQIDQVMAARVQKTMEQNLDPITGQPIPTSPQTTQLTPSVAMQLWETLGTSTPAIAQTLGISEGQRFPAPTVSSGVGGSTRPLTTVNQDRNYAFDLWEQLGSANESVASILGIPVGTPYSGQAQSSGTAYNDLDSALKNIPPTQGADLLVSLEQSGQLAGIDDNQLAILVSKYGITPDQIRQAENRATIPTQGITLPSGNVLR